MPAFRLSTKGRIRPIKSLGAEVDSLARDLGLEGGLRLYRLQTKWRALFHEGPLSLHTWPGQLYEGRLTIYADSPPWLQQVTFLKLEILTRLQPFGVSDISVRIGRAMQRPMRNEETVRRPDIDLTPQDNDAIDEVVSVLKDPELQGHVRRAMRAWARRRRIKSRRP